MTKHIDPRPAWIRQRTFELQQTGLRYIDAHSQAETEADEEFDVGDGGCCGEADDV